MAYPYYNTPQQQMPQAPQNGGFVRVKDENEVLTYPVAPGYSVVFIDEGINHLYVKTAGLSQFDRPTVEKYKLTKENLAGAANVEYVTKQDFEELKAQVLQLATLTKGDANDE